MVTLARPPRAGLVFQSQAEMMRRLNSVAAQAQVYNLAGRYGEVIEEWAAYTDPALRFGHAGFLLEMGTASSCQVDPGFRYQAIYYLDCAIGNLEEGPATSRVELPRALADRALALLGAGRLAGARDSHNRALSLAWEQLREAQDPEDLRRTRATLARVLRQSVLFSLPATAVQKLERGLSYAREAASLREEAANLNNLGVALTRLGQIARAASCFRESRDLFQSLNGDCCTDLAWNNLGHLALISKRPGEALRSFRQGRTVAGDACSASLAIRGNEAVALFHLGETTEAIGLLRELLSQAQAMHDPLYTEDLRHNLARCFFETGDAAGAIQLLEGHPPLPRPMGMEDHLNQARHASLLLDAYKKADLQDKLASSQHLAQQAGYLQTVRDCEACLYEQLWVPQLMTLC